MLSQLLHLKGIDTVVLERQSREYVLSRIRAGVLEHSFAKLMREAQCGERMDREGEIHEGFFIANNGTMKRMDLHKYSGGNSVVVYGQTELTRDLYEARDRMNGVVIHNAEDVQPPRSDQQRHRTSLIAAATTSCASIATTSSAPTVSTASAASRSRRMCCASMKGLPFGWLGVLSRTKPVSPS